MQDVMTIPHWFLVCNAWIVGTLGLLASVWLALRAGEWLFERILKLLRLYKDFFGYVCERRGIWQGWHHRNKKPSDMEEEPTDEDDSV